MKGRRVIKVILPLRLEWEPFYSVDETASVMAGTRVKVDFAGKEYVAVVSDPDANLESGLRESTEPRESTQAIKAFDEKKIKPVISISDELEVVSEQEMTLWRKVAEYYLCTVGEVYKAAYPAGKVAQEETKARMDAAKAARLDKEARKKAEMIERLTESAARRQAMADKARSSSTRERYLAEKALIDAKLRAVENASSVSGAAYADPAGNNESEPLAESARTQEIKLTPEQTAAYSQIKEFFESGKPALLRGVTGSGKTEIYLKLAQEALSKGLNVLYLVPEIALSRQLEDRLKGVFPQELRVFHSGETMATRRDSSDFIRGHRYIALGTRSALLLPHRKLGLVIVDEEHDTSYKQDSPAPRYNGRETAIMIAGVFSANVILGSATPSLESLYNCNAGRFGLVTLTKRFFDAADSDVEIIDTIAERKKNGMVGDFSRKLIGLINERLSKHEQIALLRERRAYSPVVQCESCGDIPKCKSCDVTLSLHKRSDGREVLVCHYCGRVYEYTGKCGKCGGTLKPLGAGTQKIEEEAAGLFPQARIARLDSDSARKRQSEKEIISGFSKGETDILIGTQIVAKGFDFSGLTLVAVLQADSILGQENFRADERGLQLLEQFRGRCGRRGEKGLFVIQTSQPEHPVYKALEGGTGESDIQTRFLTERKVFGYPPYSRAIGIIIKDYSQPRIDYMSAELARAFSSSGMTSAVKIVGPHAPAVDRISREWIREIRVLLPKDRFLNSNKSALSDAVRKFEKEKKYSGRISLDVDPV